MNQAIHVFTYVRTKTFVFKALHLSLLFILIAAAGNSSHAQSVGISSTSITPAPSSILELRTTTKGLLLPRLTTTERDAISSPATGLVIYNTTTNLFNFYNGTAWTSLASGAGINSISGTTNRISIGGTSTDPVIDISSNYVGQSSITTLGTIGTGTWNGSTIAIANGGTGQTSASAAFNALSPITTLGDLIYGNGANTGTRLAGNTTATKKFLTQTGNGTVSAAPAWGTLISTDVGLGNVENTALSTWTGSTNITTLGTIGTGTWNGTTIAIANGGTGQTTANTSLNALLPTQTSNANKFLQTNGTNTSWVAGNSGTVTSASVVSANGFAGTVATSTTTPALTLSTTVTGMLKGNGTALSTATSGTDYSAGTSSLATGILKSTTSTGVLSIAIAADFPTLNQNTTGSAATLTTSRNIYGNAFNGSVDLSGIIASTYGGTGNGFAKFSGPATTEKTFTLPNASATILTDNAAVTVSQGGTGQTSYTDGQILIGNTTGNTLNKSTITAGTGISITNGGGSITIANTSPSSGGTVTSVTSADGNATVANTTTTPVITIVSAPKLLTGRTLGITGDVTWTSPSFDGSGNVTASSTVTKINGTSLAGLATGILKNTTSTGVPSIAIAADFPTLNQNTTGSAATLTTSRNIYGNAFNGSVDLTGIISSTFGGTGNGFAKLTGPTTSEKTFTLPNASSTILTDNAAVTVAQGGTGQTSYTDGQILIGNTTGNTLNKSTITAGSGISITNGGGSITIANTSPSSGGTVTSASVVSANGFAGTVATATTTPALTLSTTVTGMLKGNGTALSAATSGTDYSAGTSALATGILKSTTSTGALSIAIAADFPTLNQNTTGSAATLTISRNIYGNAFNGSVDLTGIISSTFGGTGNGFAKLTGPTTSEKTFTLPNASSTILTDNAAVTVAQGGTGQTSYTDGQILIGNTTGNTLNKSTITAGTGISITNGGGSITIANTSPSSGGTVTSASVVSANGFAGTVATATTTPALTLSTTVTGMLKGNGTALSAATSGTDYSAGTSALATGILKSTTSTGVLSIAVAADFPTLNQNTTGSAGSISGTNVITAANQVQMAANSIKGNNTAGLSNELDLTVAQTKTMLSLNNVENTALSTWTGTSNITTLGTIGTGTWNATAIADGKIASALTGKTYNGLTLTAAATGFTIAGGTTSKTLTVPLDASVSGTNTGDQTITLTGDVTGSGTGSFATAIGTGKVTNTMLAGSIDVTTKVTGILPIANGGTNSSSTPTNGAVAYGNGTAIQYSALGTTGQVLQSAATSAPVWADGGTMMLSGLSNNTAVNNTTLYFPIIGGVTGAVADAQAGIRTLMSRAGTVKNLYVKISAALAAGKTGTVTVMKNGVATSLVATLSVGPVLFSDVSDSFTVAAGDEIGIKVITTGNVKFSWAADFTY